MQEVLRPLQTLTAHTAALWAPLVHDGCCCLRLAPWLSTGTFLELHMDTSGQHGLQTEVSQLCHFLKPYFSGSFHQHHRSARHHVCSCGFYFTSSRTGTGSFHTATLLPIIWLQSTSTYCLSEPVPVQADTCLLFLSLKIPISSPAFWIRSGFPLNPLKQTQDVAEKTTCRVPTRRQCVCSV